MTEQLIGVVVGFALGLIGAWARDYWTWCRERRLIRGIIAIENEDNIVLLGLLWKSATHPRPLGYSPREQIILLADHLASARTPKWYHEVWGTHLDKITTAFNRAEIQGLREFHQGLERISEIQSELRELSEADLMWLEEHPGEPHPRGRWHSYERIDVLWHEYEGIYEGIFLRINDFLLESKQKRTSGEYGRLDKPPYR